MLWFVDWIVLRSGGGGDDWTPVEFEYADGDEDERQERVR